MAFSKYGSMAQDPLMREIEDAESMLQSLATVSFGPCEPPAPAATATPAKHALHAVTCRGAPESAGHAG